MSLQELQSTVDKWIKTIGVRYFSELTNTAILMEEVGELARVMARKYGDQSSKDSDLNLLVAPRTWWRQRKQEHAMGHHRHVACHVVVVLRLWLGRSHRHCRLCSLMRILRVGHQQVYPQE